MTTASTTTTIRFNVAAGAADAELPDEITDVEIDGLPERYETAARAGSLPKTDLLPHQKFVTALLDHGSVWAGPGSWDFTCPAHDDDHPSLSVMPELGDLVPVVFTCHAGCTFKDVMTALDLDGVPLGGSISDQPKLVGTSWRRDRRSPTGYSDAETHEPLQWSGTKYGYADEQDRPLYFVLRVDFERPEYKKDFRQYPVHAAADADPRDPTTWSRAKLTAGTRPMDGVRLVLWDTSGLASVTADGGEVVLTEGEKGALIAEERGRFATTAPGGSKKKWQPEWTEQLRGAGLVTIVADRDTSGYASARERREILHAAGVPVRVVVSKTTGKGDDLAEHFAAGHGWDDLEELTETALEVEELRHEIDAAKRKKRISKLATEEFNSEQAAAGWAAKAIDSGSLAEMLDRDDPPEPWLVEGLFKLAHNVTLAAPYKTGKTTFALSFAKAVADGVPFLDRRTYLPDGAHVGWWNGEMDPADFSDYAGPLGFVHPERVAIMHLRGSSMPILDEHVAEHVVRWLAEHHVGVWVVDSWRRLASWSGVDENVNADVERLTARVDEIKREAGVRAFLTLAHTGRAEQVEGAERARGATALDDWVDARWVMTKADGIRFLAVEGRLEGMASTALVHDPNTGAITLGTGNRYEAARSALTDRAVALITARPGETTTGLAAELRVSSKHTAQLTSALHGAEIEGLVHHRDKKPRGRNWYPGARSADATCECEWGL